MKKSDIQKIISEEVRRVLSELDDDGVMKFMQALGDIPGVDKNSPEFKKLKQAELDKLRGDDEWLMGDVEKLSKELDQLKQAESESKIKSHPVYQYILRQVKELVLNPKQAVADGNGGLIRLTSPKKHNESITLEFSVLRGQKYLYRTMSLWGMVQVADGCEIEFLGRESIRVYLTKISPENLELVMGIPQAFLLGLRDLFKALVELSKRSEDDLTVVQTVLARASKGSDTIQELASTSDIRSFGKLIFSYYDVDAKLIVKKVRSAEIIWDKLFNAWHDKWRSFGWSLHRSSAGLTNAI